MGVDQLTILYYYYICFKLPLIVQSMIIRKSMRLDRVDVILYFPRNPGNRSKPQYSDAFEKKNQFMYCVVHFFYASESVLKLKSLILG